MALSISLEEYLNSIYILSNENTNVRVTDIANHVGVKKSSTNRALNTLKNQDLINYEKYQNITLTDKGIGIAKQINKRHIIFKKFLTNIIQTDEALADEEAEKLSHCVSCHTTAKLEKFIEEILKDKE